jgi:hypothetical protein
MTAGFDGGAVPFCRYGSAVYRCGIPQSPRLTDGFEGLQDDIGDNLWLGHHDDV